MKNSELVAVIGELFDDFTHAALFYYSLMQLGEDVEIIESSPGIFRLKMKTFIMKSMIDLAIGQHCQVIDSMGQFDDNLKIHYIAHLREFK